MSEYIDAEGGYYLMCAGYGAMTGSFGFPYFFPGFILPVMYLSGMAMLAIGVWFMTRPVRA